MKNNIKGQVKDYYGGIAKKVNAETKVTCGCGSSCCGDDAAINSNLYTKDYIEGLPEEAINASLGCATLLYLQILKKEKWY